MIIIKDLFLYNSWLWKCNLPEIPYDTNPESLRLEDIKRSQWSEDFEQRADAYLQPFIDSCNWQVLIDFVEKTREFNTLAKNRMTQGFFRYGKLGNQGMLDRVSYILKKAKAYTETGNKECLIDIRNAAMAEFVENPKESEILPLVWNITDPYDLRSPYMGIKYSIRNYRDYKNRSWLLDIRNLCLLEWVKESHPNAHFKSLDDEEHGERMG